MSPASPTLPQQASAKSPPPKNKPITIVVFLAAVSSLAAGGIAAGLERPLGDEPVVMLLTGCLLAILAGTMRLARPLHVGLASMSGFPIWAVIDLASNGGHSLLPFEFAIYAIYAVIGIALAMDTDEVRRTLRTETGVLLGTIAYMSPEQLDPQSGSPDARTDVYSLGILMFQLLTGRLPHDLDTLTLPNAVTVIIERDVPRLSAYGVRQTTSIARELDWILQKSTERDRDHRYQTVAELGADVRRFLANKPLEVGPPSTTYRLCKFARRHRAGVAGGVLAVTTLIAGTITTAMGWHRAVQAEGVTA